MSRCLLLVAAFLMSLVSQAATECLVGANPGSGWDGVCRGLADYWKKNSVLTKVNNMPGAGAGIALSYLSSKRSKDPNTVMATGSGMVFRFALGHYENLNQDQFEWLGALARDHAVLAVRTDSSLKTVPDFIRYIQDQKKKTKVGGGTYGGIDHIRLLQILQAGGLKAFDRVGFVPYDGGGGAALVDLLGERIEVVVSDVSEVMSFYKAGKIRFLAVFSERRLSQIPKVPTAKEQGLNVVSPNWRGILVSKEMEEGRRKNWTERLKAAATSPRWKSWCQKQGLEQVWISGAKLRDLIDEDTQRFVSLSATLPKTQ